MTTVKEINTNNICRVCMSTSDLRSLFTSSKKKFVNVKTLSDMVMECTSLIVSETDNLPKKICQKCVYRVNQFYKFKEKAKHIDKKLREQLNQQNDVDEDLKTSIKSEINLDNLEDSFNNDDNCTELFNTNLEIKKEELKEEDTQVKIENNKENESNLLGGTENLLKFNDTVKTRKKSNKKKARCIKKISQKVTLQSLNEEGLAEYQCNVCQKILSTPRSLARHITITHSDNKPFPCDTCGKSFKRLEHLNTHKRIHTGERPFKCATCNKGFTQKTTLNCHIRTHTGEKPEICTVCGKRFSQAITLIYHMRTHTGETPFKCKICGKGFTHAGNLNIHMRFHSGERPHECTICSQKFFTSSHLSLHMKNHRGEKNHACSICEKRFLRKQHLRDHILMHTGGRPHECHLCTKKYTQKSHLRRHLKGHLQTAEKLPKN